MANDNGYSSPPTTGAQKINTMKILDNFGCEYYAKIQATNGIFEGYLHHSFKLTDNYIKDVNGTLYSYRV